MAATTAGPARVLIADDMPDVRQMLGMVLSADEDFIVVGEAADGAEAIARAAALEPDAVIIDLVMPVVGGLEAIPQIRRSLPNATILLFSGSPTEGMLEDAIAAGADGFVDKSMGLRHLSRKLREMRGGGTPV